MTGHRFAEHIHVDWINFLCAELLAERWHSTVVVHWSSLSSHRNWKLPMNHDLNRLSAWSIDWCPEILSPYATWGNSQTLPRLDCPNGPDGPDGPEGPAEPVPRPGPSDGQDLPHVSRPPLQAPIQEGFAIAEPWFCPWQLSWKVTESGEQLVHLALGPEKKKKQWQIHGQQMQKRRSMFESIILYWSLFIFVDFCQESCCFFIHPKAKPFVPNAGGDCFLQCLLQTENKSKASANIAHYEPLPWILEVLTNRLQNPANQKKEPNQTQIAKSAISNTCKCL